MKTETENQPDPNTVPSYYRKGFVLVLLFTTMGVLGLPLLIKSPYFTKGEKQVWGVLVTLWTFALFFAAFAAVYWAYSTIMNALAI